MTALLIVPIFLLVLVALACLLGIAEILIPGLSDWLDRNVEPSVWDR